LFINKIIPCNIYTAYHMNPSVQWTRAVTVHRVFTVSAGDIVCHLLCHYSSDSLHVVVEIQFCASSISTADHI